MSTLYVIATPIGNLGDITLRALETLKRVSVVYAEDTRVTRKLLDHYEITTPLKSYHQHSGIRVTREIRGALGQGDVALVTDAGTPGVADPGNELIEEIVGTGRDLSVQVKIVPIPGASAVTAAASISGFNMSRFTFMGYVPKKKGRARFFREVAASDMPVILYETPYRIVRTLEELRNSIVGTGRDLSLRRGDHRSPAGEHCSPLQVGDASASERRIVVCRELTKQFESIYRGTIEEVLEQVKKDPVRGEYAIVVESS